MADRTRARSAGVALALALTLAAAWLAGRELGDWVILSDQPIGFELARYWPAIPALVLAFGGLALIGREARPALAAGLAALALGAACLGAWQAVDARATACREGPLDAAL